MIYYYKYIYAELNITYYVQIKRNINVNIYSHICKLRMK